MQERSGIVALRGAPLTLTGHELKTGDTAPDFTVLDNDLAEKTLADFARRPLVLATVPSLDTPVCDMETRRFNQEAASLSDKVALVTVSMDLPFAQKRWCGAAGVDRVVTLSDHREASLGLNYGLLIKELRLLARAVLVINPAGVITHLEIVGDISEEPDYDAALAAVRAL